MKDKPLVSIVIPTYNSEKTLAECLESIKNQTYECIEVIIVDKFSKDKTVEIAKSYGVKVISAYANKPEARNIGILNSRGDYVLLLDSDMVLENKLVEEAVDKFQKEGCDAIFIDEEYANDGFWKNVMNLEKKIYKGNIIIEAPRFFKKEVFQKVLFDDKNEGMDEYDFYLSAKKFGLKGSRINSKIILLESPFKLKKKFHHGKFFPYYKFKHRGEEAVSKQISLPYRVKLLYRSFEISPVHGLGLFFIKLLEYLAFVSGIFYSYFDRRTLRLQFNVKEEFDIMDPEAYERGMFRKSEGAKFVDEKERETILNLLKELNIKDRVRVLDVGAGSGRFTKEFIKLGFDVTALDISKQACEYLRKSFDGLDVVNGDIEKIALPPASFDLIFSFRSFKYVNNKEKAPYNLKTLLKRNGYAIIEMPNLLNPFYFLPYLLAPLIYRLSKGSLVKYLIIADFYTKGTFKKKLENAEFKMEKIVNLLFFPHLLYSKIQNRTILRIVYLIDSLFSNWLPRSLIFVAKRI
jgi:glycosyltransferase involved in cell wall biosynthesis/ubiquinone/menaquinone biosynthesis C-methylase UbiE